MPTMRQNAAATVVWGVVGVGAVVGILLLLRELFKDPATVPGDPVKPTPPKPLPPKPGPVVEPPGVSADTIPAAPKPAPHPAPVIPPGSIQGQWPG